MESPINELERTLWDYCVRQLAAKDAETYARWQSDPIAYFQEGFAFEPLPSHLEPLVEQAIESWKGIEEKVCSRLEISREQFLSEFEKARVNFQSGSAGWMRFSYSYGEAVYGAVLNADVANLWAWVLPTVDPTRIDEYRAIGKMVVATFYTDRLHYGDQPNPNDPFYRTMEWRWHLVN